MPGLRSLATVLFGAFVVTCLLPPSLSAQYSYRPPSNPATGEDYHVEASVGLWYPNVSAIVSSESLGIIGTRVDVVNDLGVQDDQFVDFRLVLRPGRKHKFRLSFTPVKYETESVLSRTIVFNGITYQVGLPVNTLLDWKVWRFGYEYDFIYRDRGFVGFIAEAKYTDVRAELTSPFNREFSSVKAPIPALGIIARGYAAPNVSITGEFTGFKLPGDFSEEQDAGQYFEIDVYGTLNFTNNVGVSGGYRSLAVKYQIDQDFGDLKLDGFYFSGVVRF